MAKLDRKAKLLLYKEWNMLAKSNEQCVVCGKPAEVICNGDTMFGLCGEPVCLDCSNCVRHR